MGTIEAIVLVVAGFAVGYINTIAGGATIISLSVLMFMGMPLNVANGTHRIAAAFQTFVSVSVFRAKGALDLRKGLKLGLPAVTGSLLGAYLGVEINEEVFSKLIGMVMVGLLALLLFRPKLWLNPQSHLQRKPVSVKQVIIFFALGFYGGFLYVGIGYFLLAALALSAGYDLVRANAVKVLIVMLYVPFSLAVYIWGGLIDWQAGLALAAGQGIGAWAGVQSAATRGAGFIRWFMIIFLLISILQIFGFVDFAGFF